jgi:hypothetical protein
MWRLSKHGIMVYWVIILVIEGNLRRIISRLPLDIFVQFWPRIESIKDYTWNEPRRLWNENTDLPLCEKVSIEIFLWSIHYIPAGIILHYLKDFFSFFLIADKPTTIILLYHGDVRVTSNLKQILSTISKKISSHMQDVYIMMYKCNYAEVPRNEGPLYARVSTADHDQSPEVQLLHFRKFGELRGWKISREHIDTCPREDSICLYSAENDAKLLITR